MSKKPRLSFWQIWNVSFGYLGIQIGFALQSAQVSRIFANLGADLHDLSFFWLAAPIMGLVVQPIVGAASDKTWNKLGRRGPYIFWGAFVAAVAMWLMPNAGAVVALVPALIFAAIMFATMDGSFNITMQPFRALVSDMVPDEQRTFGYSIQSFLINTGAVIGFALPYLLTNVFGLANNVPEGQVAPSVVWSFYIGGGVLLLSVIWTVFSTKEYEPKTYCEQNDIDYDKWINENNTKKNFRERVSEFGTTLKNMPKVMKQLSYVQFFSWFAFYIMWVYTVPAVAQNVFGTSIDDKSSEAFGNAGDWVGVLFAVQSLAAALFAVGVMTPLAKKIGRKSTYSLALVLGGIGFISMFFISSPSLLFLPMIGIGVAWAAILAMPFSILSESLPADKTGVYMGIFNFTIAGPQIVSGLIAGPALKAFFGNQAIYMMIISGVSILLAALCVRFVTTDENKKEESTKIQSEKSSQ